LIVLMTGQFHRSTGWVRKRANELSDIRRYLEGGMATNADLSMAPRTGCLLDGRYRLGELIGTGGMSSVHAARDIRLDRTVAVKLFRPNADETALARLAEEARLLAGLSHPGVLRVFDVSTSARQPYLVMELVEGSTLRRLIDLGPIAPHKVAKVGVRLADTLAHVHSRRIVHRDIKPSNVLLDKDGAAYLADFGIARAIGTARMTAGGLCVGTAAYLAPEQVAGMEVGPAADIYALGLVLLECLTSRPEYTGSAVEAAVARLHRAPQMPDWLPAPWRDTLTAMTAINPRARPAAGQCAELLSAADPRAGQRNRQGSQPVTPRQGAYAGSHGGSAQPHHRVGA
jgi:eukaryotic-like serine/threonine-protein kinase